MQRLAQEQPADPRFFGRPLHRIYQGLKALVDFVDTLGSEVKRHEKWEPSLIEMAKFVTALESDQKVVKQSLDKMIVDWKKMVAVATEVGNLMRKMDIVDQYMKGDTQTETLRRLGEVEKYLGQESRGKLMGRLEAVESFLINENRGDMEKRIKKIEEYLSGDEWTELVHRVETVKITSRRKIHRKSWTYMGD